MLIQKFPTLAQFPTRLASLQPAGRGERGEKSHENFKTKFNSSFQNIKFYTLKYLRILLYITRVTIVRGRREVTGFSTDNVIFLIKSVGAAHINLSISRSLEYFEN